MYLSKLVLDPSHPQARRDLASAYEMHRTLSRAFIAPPAAAPLRFLWRLEDGGSGTLGAEGVVLVQSASPGYWEFVTQESGYAFAVHPNKRVDRNSLLRSGRTYLFRLKCNPTVTRDGKRHGLVCVGEQLAWLDRQADSHGFEVVRGEVMGNQRITVRQARGGHFMSVQAVRFDGVLRATDVDKLGAALVNGIGHAKALGLGMLSLAPTPLADGSH